MNSPVQLTAFALQDVAGDSLLQETPYPVVAPRTIETLMLVVQYARIEGLKVVVLGAGSSFADNFRLPHHRVLAVMTYRLGGIQQLSPYTIRILSGTSITRLFGSNAITPHRTIGGLIAGGRLDRDSVASLILSHLLTLEIINPEAKIVRLAGPGAASSDDPGLARAVFGSKGHFGVITAIEVARSLPREIKSEPGPEVFTPAASTYESPIKPTDICRLFDPDGLFAW